MKYLSIPAMLLASSAVLCAPVYASESDRPDRNTAVLPQAGQTMNIVLQKLSAKYDKEISSLDLSAEQLKAIVYVRPDWVREPIPFSTVKEFAAVLFAQPGLQSVKIIKYGEYLGFYVKMTGLPADGYALYPQENSYLLKGIVDDEGLLETIDAREEELLFQSFYPKAMTALTDNGFKG
ncbi:hypothetical protein [Klebsiella sp. BIGb0407]|uniref:hypothetical protein n=1 Tax=Klebsiella sp. BIGb0407 TaxID=2940603 RepID=UPI0021680385|nr:hypothetical protein [Klebsiella sp. BIGb0407]MCS3434122.1 hypothetical protein [Klebsiella sp. BIGb0407]